MGTLAVSWLSSGTSHGYIIFWMAVRNLSQKLNELIQRNVMDIATHKVISVKPETELGDVAEILGSKKIKKVPVIQDGLLVGIISRGDLLRFVASHYIDA